jgi:hypothetical protein
MDDEEYFGEIEHFFQFQNDFFCFINVYETDIYISKYFPKTVSFFYQTFMNYISDFFSIVNKKNINKTNLRIINCNLIKYKCIKIFNNENLFISKIKYDFEHD